MTPIAAEAPWAITYVEISWYRRKPIPTIPIAQYLPMFDCFFIESRDAVIAEAINTDKSMAHNPITETPANPIALRIDTPMAELKNPAKPDIRTREPITPTILETVLRRLITNLDCSCMRAILNSSIAKNFCALISALSNAS